MAVLQVFFGVFYFFLAFGCAMFKITLGFWRFIFMLPAVKKHKRVFDSFSLSREQLVDLYNTYLEISCDLGVFNPFWAELIAVRFILNKRFPDALMDGKP